MCAGVGASVSAAALTVAALRALRALCCSGVSLVSTALVFPVLCWLKMSWAEAGACSRAAHCVLLALGAAVMGMIVINSLGTMFG